VGVFAPAIKCEWKGPSATDPVPDSRHVLASPLIANLPNDSGTAAEIIAVTSNGDTGASSSASYGVIRILNGQTCQLLETIDLPEHLRDAATPSIADLDNDGKLEIVARTNGFSSNNRIVAFKWNGARFERWWISEEGTPSDLGDNWDGISIHDLTDDGLPEIIGRHGEVYNGQTGQRMAAADPNVLLNTDPVLGDVDHDGEVELIANKIFRWTGSGWTVAYPGYNSTTLETTPRFFAYADFGTPMPGGGFDRTKLDGIAEVVSTGPVFSAQRNGVPESGVAIHTLDGTEVLRVSLPAGELGGPPTIGDFDGDGLPEVASAGATAYRVFDLKCDTGTPGCASKWIRWAKPSQDATSGQTGSTIFDFDGDGAAEAVYADECFLRIYKGATGEVLFSGYRNSCTWLEQPIIGDSDNDGRTDIVVNSNPNCYVRCPSGQSGTYIDPIDPGVRCLTNDDCVAGNCNAGFCRCTTDEECGNHWMPDPRHPLGKPGLVCAEPLAGTLGTGNVCRMQHPNPTARDDRDLILSGVKVYHDARDRWASSRPLWNQNAYNITNINDDGKVPRTSEWKQNFLSTGPGGKPLNNYRENVQGLGGTDLLADITGVMDKNVCQTSTLGVKLTAQVCNRGLRGIGASMPASFYLGDVAADKLLCQAETTGPVPVGGCLPISCNIPMPVPAGSTITMVVNDAGHGNRVVDECIYANNTSRINIMNCVVVN
jgi:hypothetical protein